jgi:hypothetical protein
MALTAAQKLQCYNTVNSSVGCLGGAEWLRSYISQGGQTASDPVALATLIVADVEAFRQTNLPPGAVTQLPGFKFDYPAEAAARLVL